MGITDTDRTLPTNRMVFDLRRDRELRARFERDGDAVMREYGLSEDEQRAWREGDIAWFAKAGVHPYFLPQISRLNFGSAYNHNRSEAALAYAKHMVK